MKNFNTLLAAAFVATSLSASAQATFTPSEASFPNARRTNMYAADFNNNGRLDIYFGGQLDAQLDNLPGIWGWTTLSTMMYNSGQDSWAVDCLTAAKNEGDDNYHIVGTQHGLRLGSFNNFAGIDYNNDGLVDILMYANDNSDDWFMPDEMKQAHLSLYRNNGDGTFTLVEETGFPSARPEKDGACVGIAVADYDRDGYVDVLVSGNLEGSSRVDGYPGRLTALYRNVDGTGTFERMDIAETKGGVYDNNGSELKGWFLPISGNVHMADLDNDGWVDIVVAGYADNCWDENWQGAGNRMRVYMNREGRSFEDVTSDVASDLNLLRNSGSVIADLDADGYLDFFMSGWSDSTGWEASVIYNDLVYYEDPSIFAYTFTKEEYGFDGTEGVKHYIRDFNGDGHYDVVYASDQHNITIYYGDENGAFTKTVHENTPFGGDNSHGIVADFNGNGLPDFASAGSDAATQVFYNTTDVELPAIYAPANVDATLADGVLTITWDEVEGADWQRLAYNIFVKSENGIYCLVPADPETGFVKVSNERVAALRPGVTSYSIPFEGDCTVGVQTISLLNETYSEFATVKVADLSAAEVAEVAAFDINVDNSGLTVAGEGQVKVYNALGQVVATGVAGEHINVAAKGVLFVNNGATTVKVVK